MKFIAGLVCGIILCFTTAAVSPNTIQAILFPSKVTIHDGNTVKELENLGEFGVINYKNKSYIPLRNFAEGMGAYVDYKEPSVSNGNLHQIDIFTRSGVDALSLTDTEGYVNIGNFIQEQEPSGQSIEIKGGTIKINKDLSGKQIELRSIDKNRIQWTSEYFFMDGEPSKLPKVGDILTFRTSLATTTNATYQVIVHDIVNPFHIKELEGSTPPVTVPLYGILTPPSSAMNGYPQGERDALPFTLSFMNTGKDTLVLDGFSATLNIYETDKDNNKKKLVYTYRIPEIKGKLSPLDGYTIQIPWYQIQSDGTRVPKGEYLVELELPKQINYLNETTKKKEAWVIELRYGNYFGISVT